MKRRILGLLAVLLMTGPGAAGAVSLYSNLGPGDSFGSAGWLLNAPGPYMQFVATASGIAVSVDAPVIAVDNVPPTQFALYADSGSDTVGSLLASTQSLVVPTYPAIVNFAFLSSVNLVAGQKYWLNGIGNYGWLSNSEGVTGNMYSRLGVYVTGSLGAFRINGPSAVPEPGTLALMGAGLIGLATVRRRSAPTA